MAVYFFQSARRLVPTAATRCLAVVLTWGGMVDGAAAIAAGGAAGLVPLRSTRLT